MDSFGLQLGRNQHL